LFGLQYKDIISIETDSEMSC